MNTLPQNVPQSATNITQTRNPHPYDRKQKIGHRLRELAKHLPLSTKRRAVRKMRMHSDPTGILGAIALIAGVHVVSSHPYGTLQPTGVFAADPRLPRQQPRPTGILIPDPNHQRQLRPTGIIAADPTGIYLQGPSYNRHRRADSDKSILDPTGKIHCRNELALKK